MLASAVSLAAETPGEPFAGAFLEFLADWEDERGEWQDPLEYQNPQWRALRDKWQGMSQQERSEFREQQRRRQPDARD